MRARRRPEREKLGMEAIFLRKNTKCSSHQHAIFDGSVNMNNININISTSTNVSQN